MAQTTRQQIMAAADAVVVKVGTRVLTNAEGMLDDGRVASLAGQLARICHAGRRVVLVSSGAVGAGLGRLEQKQRPTDVAQLQAAAAIGQSLLIESYNRALESHQLHAAQVLLTAEDLQSRSRYLNVRNTLFALFACGAVPIINENDTVCVDELLISFGDNDHLAALVTNLIRAPLLVLLSDVEGVFSGPPDDPSSSIVPVIEDLESAQAELVHDGVRGGLGRGGMASKLRAARIATSAGENVVIASGTSDSVLEQILAGEEVGTLILAEGRSVDARRRWIGWSAQPAGQLTLDGGACQAIASDGRSLLSVGVSRVTGQFAKGDVVALCDESGREIARGLINYSSDEMQKIAGQPKAKIAEILGHRPYDEAVHRDNLVLFG